MASTRRKAAALAIAVVGVAGLSLAAAAQLTVNNTTLQAGTTTVDAACDDDGVTMDYEYTFDAGEYVLSAVEVTGIDEACETDSIGVTLIPETGTAITLGDKTIGATEVAWSGATDLNGATIGSIFDVAVVIHN